MLAQLCSSTENYSALLIKTTTNSWTQLWVQLKLAVLKGYKPHCDPAQDNQQQIMDWWTMFAFFFICRNIDGHQHPWNLKYVKWEKCQLQLPPELDSVKYFTLFGLQCLRCLLLLFLIHCFALSGLINDCLITINHKPAAASVTHNLEARYESLTRFGSSWLLWAFFLKTLTVQLSQQTDWAPLLFFQHYHTVLRCQASDMVKGTTAVFIVLLVVPVAFVQQCLLSTICPHQLHSSSTQLSKCTCFSFFQG